MNEVLTDARLGVAFAKNKNKKVVATPSTVNTTVHSLQSPRIQSNHTSNSKTKNGTVRQGAPPRPPRIHPISNAHQHSPIPQLSKDWEAIPLQYTTRPPQGSPIGIRRETGRGRVFVTRHIKTNTVLEMKVVNLRHAAAFEVENIMAEVAALQRIQARPHRFLIKLPNPKMFDPSIWWSDYGYLYIISQYHPSTLRAYIKNSYVIESCLGFIIGELLLGIDHLHRLGIIHKNISPDNIFIDKEGHCVIGDFDRSVVLPGPANHVILKANRIYNSSSTFVAPELVRYTKDSEKEYIIFDYTVDFFSLGASIYYLVTGELLIERIYAQEPLDSEAVEKKILNMRATGRCPCAVISFVMCLCHINREKRIRMEDALDLAAKTEWMNNIALGTSPLLPLLATPTPEQFPTLSFLSDVSSPNSIDPEKETRCFLDGFHKELYPSRGPLIPHVDISKSPRSGLDFNIPILDGLNLETPVALTSRKKIQRPVAYEKGAVNWHVDDRPMVVPDAGAKGCDTNATESIRSIQYNQAVAHARQPLQLECPNAHTHKQLAGDPNHWQPVSVEVVGITQRSKAKRPEGLLAVGGFGRVFVVQNSKTNRVLVMKIADLIEAHVDEDGSMMDTATNEVVALKRIAKHPNRFTLGLWPESSQDPSIWISETGYLHIVTDYYPNDLADYRHSILPDRTDCIGLIITEVLLGLSHLHNIGIIHGDIKPENIFVDMMGHCVIGDYGGAIVNESAERWEVVPHCRDNYFHTPEYCAPEPRTFGHWEY
ncbi:kinase-like domain-containing protein [Crucibulum laeve]|uniref:Kinase-like domain-containing protein n=1 Tax=Crucibulum laeve TaxID=68775 RepID=A0A5C3LE95_9AGAR|nr:kinase-like domain-containing protein [Crucibulum laeve]